ncbi:glycoside hydrolase family 3 C-terminal domain-containing protein [Streptacidiphilus sp. EB103A]|uniref:beta-glucosidase n=1 Tax=Streptacidiphilus sp. EB103A TaxID=3156275 RepID=UPI003515E4FA
MPPPPAAQADLLLSQLTTAEKIAFLHQHQPAVPRLGLAAFVTGCEVLHGVCRAGRATVFPQAVGLGATWDRDLLRRVGEAVSTEVRAFHQDPAGALVANEPQGRAPIVSLNAWGPVVNPLRDPRWGRNEEGYSEDPYATAQLAEAYCRGLRGDDPQVWRTTPVLKHFLAHNLETDRATADITVPERTLHEYELPAFRGPIEAGVVAGVMPAYNLVNGVPNHVHPLLAECLHSWDPDLALCSDQGGPSNLVEREAFYPAHAEAHAAALKAGVDSYTENDEDPAPTVERFTEALAQDLVSESDIDTAVRRLLLLRARTGEFAPDTDPYRMIDADAVVCAAHRELALAAAQASIVLLKNDGVLPLAPGPGGPGGVAVIGHLGSRVLTDWYSGALPYAVSIADGLAGAAPQLGPVIAVDGADTIVLHAETGGRTHAFGPYRHQDWGTSVQCPVPVHTLQDVVSGNYLSLTGPEETEAAAVAGSVDGWFVKELWEFEPAPAADETGSRIIVRSNAETSRRYLQVEPGTGRLLADAESPDQATRFRLEVRISGVDEAVAAADGADHVIVVLGNDPHINGRETIDRDSLALPARQEELLRAVAAAHPGLVLVLVASYPYAIDWAVEHVPAILWTAHGGQELGTAMARSLTGVHNPAGRLPQTWYAATAQLPAPQDYDIIGSQWTYQYSRRDHLFPFGHGLSYTTFAYGDLTARPNRAGEHAAVESVTVRATVTNTGRCPGQEVVQLYSHYADPEAPPTPLRKLQGFSRVTLAPGETRAVTFELAAANLAHYASAQERLVVLPGRYELAVGGSSAVLPAAVTLDLPAAT